MKEKSLTSNITEQETKTQTDITISVIIPAFNASKTIKTALESVFAQNVSEIIEIIVINDGSWDDTANICKSFFHKMSQSPVSQVKKLSENSRIITTQNNGVASARNLGISQAKGSHIAFLDSDDAWLSEKTNKQLKVFRTHTDAFLCATSCDFKKNTTNTLLCITKHNLLYRNLLYTSSIIVRKNESVVFCEKLKRSEDYHLWLKLASTLPKDKALYKIDEVLFHYATDSTKSQSSGLSSNHLLFEKDELRNFQMLFQGKYITFIEYITASLFSMLKFVSRMLRLKK